ncbi:DUF4232 domain-containing protein [Nocardia africana]|uniref:DUF4232 domain-containing protein n=1 Tax=Nocardia africana TaxID=134964 RepID=A0A378WYE7_9NOCA|nr:DUF4232 domain-containing protein [Nocardia africana]MCC3313302.1 DUF4232 domain-containing protein [Nocardia africana]SUA45343.1 Uncharacterised protein [Nocardia africana]
MTIGRYGYRTAAVVVLGATALGSCAQHGSGPAPSARPATETSAAQTPSPQANPTTGSTTTASAVAPCRPRQLDTTAHTLSPGMMHRGVELTFALAADTPPCTIAGYPGVDTGEGGPVLHARRTPRGYMGGLPRDDDTPPVVTVLPGRPARAVVEGSAMGPAGEDCPLYTSLVVTAPDSIDTRTVHTTIDTCALEVHPVTG